MDLTPIFSWLWSPEFQEALKNIVLLGVGLFTTALLANGSLFFRSHITVDQLATLKEAAALAVKAAEQAGLAGLIRDKKASAMLAVQNTLNALKITSFTAADIDAAIEAAVLEFNQREGYIMEMQAAEKNAPQFQFPTTFTSANAGAPTQSETEDDGA